MKNALAPITAWLVFATLGSASVAAHGETTGPATEKVSAGSPTTDDAQALRAELMQRIQAIDEQQRALVQQLETVERQRKDLELLVHRVADLGSYRGGTDAGNTAEPPAEVASERKAERDAQEDRMPELPRVSQEIGGVLTPRGRLVVEPSLQYIYSSVNRISIEGFTILPALIIGLIEIVDVDRDMLIGALTTRYGLTDRLELELKVPYLYRRDSTRTREILSESVRESVISGDGDGLGDIEFDLRYQFPRRSPAWPHIVGNLRTKTPTGSDPFDPDYTLETGGKLPTGSGFWSINPSLTFIYPTDPVVFYGNIGYLWTLKDDKDAISSGTESVELGDVDPGDAIRLSFGLGLGLNDRSSFSIGYSLDLFNRTTIETLDIGTEIFQRNKLAGSDVTVGKLLLGYSLRLPGGTPLNLALGIGATEDAPDTELTFRVPFTVVD